MANSALKKVPPRGPKAAFAFFVQSCRKKYEQEYGTEPPIFADFMKDRLSKWENLPEPEKAPFQQLAAEDKNRYDKETKKQPNKHQAKGEKRKVSFTELKLPMSAFCWFCEDQRPLVMSEHPDFDICKVTVIMAQRWKNASNVVRQKYEIIANNDKARYTKETTDRKQLCVE